MPDPTALAKHYKTLTDDEILNLKREGGFTAEAEHVLAEELERRNLRPHDEKQYVASINRNKLQEEVTERGGGYRELGFQFFGKRYLNQSDRNADIQVRTKWFTMSGIPLIPIASYRFKASSSLHKWKVIDRTPLDWVQVFQTWMRTAITLIAILLVTIAICWVVDRAKHH